ncbi:MAG: cyclic nucleotide-binding domain-containing protein [Proteobacteria bacterium]|jgi:CRP-like cAMP-binding protein|nr:cyclic nucleotide-binding domain-containing protein [Pseudomonadota bacterium]
MSEHIQKESFKSGEFIFFEGDIDFHFYIVEKGSVQIFTKSKAGVRIDISSVEEGESFGEFALLSNAPRSASAQAKTDCVLVKVSQEGYQQLLSELPIWASSMLVSFAARLKNLTEALKASPQFLKKD